MWHTAAVGRTRRRDPRYREIESWLRDQCRAVPVGTLLPSETDVAMRFAVSRMTARQAIQVLVQDGLVERRRGAGTFVASPRMHRGESVLRSFSQDMRLRGLVPSSRVLLAELGTAPTAAAQLGLPPDAWVVRIDRVRYASGTPLALERAVLPDEFAAVLDADLANGSLHASLAAMGRTMGKATGYVMARLATNEEAELLDLKTPTALLVETRLITDLQGKSVESTETAYVASRWVIDTGAYIPPVTDGDPENESIAHAAAPKAPAVGPNSPAATR
jgi:GntR family transcriptional regulator